MLSMLIQFPLSGEEQTVFNYEFWQRTGLESATNGTPDSSYLDISVANLS
jgi:hypothetical protein